MSSGGVPYHLQLFLGVPASLLAISARCVCRHRMFVIPLPGLITGSVCEIQRSGAGRIQHLARFQAALRGCGHQGVRQQIRDLQYAMGWCNADFKTSVIFAVRDHYPHAVLVCMGDHETHNASCTAMQCGGNFDRDDENRSLTQLDRIDCKEYGSFHWNCQGITLIHLCAHGRMTSKSLSSIKTKNDSLNFSFF